MHGLCFLESLMDCIMGILKHSSASNAVLNERQAFQPSLHAHLALSEERKNLDAALNGLNAEHTKRL